MQLAFGVRLSRRIAALLVRCAENLLLCQELESPALYFDRIEICLAELPRIIAEAKQSVIAPYTVIMGKCRFQMPRDRRSPPAFQLRYIELNQAQVSAEEKPEAKTSVAAP